MKRSHEFGTVGEKAVIEIHQTHKFSQFSLGGGLWKILDDLNYLEVE